MQAEHFQCLLVWFFDTENSKVLLSFASETWALSAHNRVIGLVGD